MSVVFDINDRRTRLADLDARLAEIGKALAERAERENAGDDIKARIAGATSELLSHLGANDGCVSWVDVLDSCLAEHELCEAAFPFEETELSQPTIDAQPTRESSVKAVLAPAVETARRVVLGELPDLWPPIRASLATVAALRLASLDLCPNCILTGPSGVKKSTIVDMLTGTVGTVRVDSVTAACFVSSSANTNPAALKRQVDILPRIQHKAMLTRDLSTVFRQNPDQLRSLFGVLVPLLDGKGYAPASGTQGLRDDATGNYIFCWIAATVPFPPQTWDTQKRFGSRLTHYDMFKPPNMSDEDVLKERQGKDFSEKVNACKEALHTVLTLIFVKRLDGIAKAAPFSVTWGSDPKDVTLWRVKLARFLVTCRRTRGNIDEDDLDDPHRVISQLEAVTRGSAMLDDRTVVTTADLGLAVQMVLSSSKHGRVLRALAESQDDFLSVKQCAARFGWSEQTARNRMDHLVSLTGDSLVKWVDPALTATGRGRPTEKVLVPVDPWLWLLDLKRCGLI
jgi:hypothetical protein